MHGWRRSHLYRVRLWRVVLEHGMDLLAIDLDWNIVANPLPHLRAARPPPADVVAIRDSRGYLNVGNMWIRSTDATRAMATVVENRTWVAWEQQVFNEELNFNARFAGVTCCHTACLGKTAVKATKSQQKDLPSKDANGRKARVEVDGVERCTDLRGRLRAQPPPEGSKEPWVGSWLEEVFNTRQNTKERPVGRCNAISNSCPHWKASHCAVHAGNTPGGDRTLQHPQ